MRAVFSVALALVIALALSVRAAEKEVTLKGKVTCAKCECKIADKCATVLVVPAAKKGDKPTVYWFDADAHKKFHGAICKKGKEGTVTGTVSKDGDKNIITVSKVDYAK
jgi:hypothetical protein